MLVNCPQNNGFKPRAEDIDAAITPKTKWLILNNPNNPTGACCSAEEIAAIAAVMRKHPHVWILSDDMYEHLVFDGFQHATLRSRGAGPEGPDADRVGRFEDLCHDRLACRFRRRPEGADQGDDGDAGPGDSGDLHRGAGRRGRCAGWAAGRRGRADRGVSAPARPRGGDAERGEGHLLPQAGRRVLCVPERCRMPWQDDHGRAHA